MLIYVVICVALALAGAAGMQFFYLAYLEKINKQQKRRLLELERHNTALYRRWQEAEHQLAAYNALAAEEIIHEDEEEIWSEIIEDDAIR
jgi:16S rRNA C1402 (ribose-2'-O) methylase RsmI